MASIAAYAALLVVLTASKVVLSLSLIGMKASLSLFTQKADVYFNFGLLN